MINGFYQVLRQVFVRGIPALERKMRETPQQREDQRLKREEEDRVRRKNRKWGCLFYLLCVLVVILVLRSCGYN